MILSVERALECSSFPRRPTRVLLRPKSLSGLVGISFEASHFASLTFLRGRKFLIKEKITIIMNAIGIKMESRRDNKLSSAIFVISKFSEKHPDLFPEFG